MLRTLLFLLLSCIFSTGLCIAQSQADTLLTIIEEELTREVEAFKKADTPPYYIGYRVNEYQGANISASFGSITSKDHSRSRAMAVDVRVGDYSFDNTHPVDDLESIGNPGFGFGGGQPNSFPLDNHPLAIKTALWEETQTAYRSSLAVYKSKKNAKKKDSHGIPDFSKEKPIVHVDASLPALQTFYNPQQWTDRIKQISALFLANPNVVQGDVSLEIGLERRYLVTSEGTRIVQNRTYAYLFIRGTIRATDGDVLPLSKSYFGFSPTEIPSDEIISKDVAAMMDMLNQLRTAPIAEPYTGPAILDAHAAGVFFHEIFGHRVEGHRLKDEYDGQTFKDKIDERVLPASLSVVFDPTMDFFKGQALNGYYQYDDQGIKSKPVRVVENGSLKTFLMSRTPIENFNSSNGHGRAQGGMDVVARQSNLIIENKKVVPIEGLRKMLIAECKKQNKKYGYLFKDVEGGFTNTGRFMPNAFNIFPTVVYRVYADGRPDELVRGVDLIGTPLAMFAEIKAADDQYKIFTGFCGAESGSIPVTAISPSLFVKRIETQKKAVEHVDKPLTPRPSNAN